MNEEHKKKIDLIWNTLWSNGISNPLTVIEQITYLLFIKRLDDLHTNREKMAADLKKTIENPIFAGDEQELRWSVFKKYGSGKNARYRQG